MTTTHIYRQTAGYLLCIGGLLSILWLASAFNKGVATQDWLETRGLILRSDKVRATHILGQETAMYESEVHYRYRVNGKSYDNDDVYAADLPFMSLERVNSLIDKFPLGSVHDLYYDPDAPERSVLERGTPTLLIFSAFPAVLFLVLGIKIIRRTS